jgi:hypothetical protein
MQVESAELTLRKLTPRKPTARSRASNGIDKLLGVADMRSSAARRYRDLCIDLANEQGGIGVLTIADRGMIKSAAVLLVQAEQMQAAAISGDPAVDNKKTDPAYIRSAASAVELKPQACAGEARGANARRLSEQARDGANNAGSRTRGR